MTNQAGIMGHPAALLAHELGHAQSAERTKYPKLRSALEAASVLGGAVGGAAYMLKGRPIPAAIASTMIMAPTLIEEARASIKGVRALKNTNSFSTKELKAMRGQLLSAYGTYAAVAGGLVGSTAAWAKAIQGKKNSHWHALLSPASLLTAEILKKGLVKRFRGQGNRTPIIRSADAKTLRGAMKVKAGIYNGKPNLPGTALYVRKNKFKSDNIRKAFASEIAKLLKDGDKKQRESAARKMLREGGVIVSPSKLKRKSDIMRSLRAIGARSTRSNRRTG
jgi:hypothetical protein